MKIIYYLINRRRLLLVAIIMVSISGCKKLVDPGLPPNRVVSATVYNNDSLAESVLLSIYSKSMEAFGFFNGYMSKFGSLMSDELDRLIQVNPDAPFIINTINRDNQIVQQVWNSGYEYIGIANDVIQGLTNQSGVTPALRAQLLGEAYFLRAFTYFYLINLFGDVPLVLTTDYTVSSKLGRMPMAEVYERIVSDLQEAQRLLPIPYAITPGSPLTRVRPNKFAATAMLARVYLFQEKWEDAESEARQVIESNLYALEPNIDEVFNYNSNEAILQFMPVGLSFNTAEAAFFVPAGSNSKPLFILTDSFMRFVSTIDKRRSWIRTVTVGNITYNSPYKYKVNQGPPYQEYNMVLRLPEQHLTRAEALTRQNKPEEAIVDINIIRSRAGLSPLSPPMSQKELLDMIMHERLIEFFVEWGHRWFDLKRWPSELFPLDLNKKRVDDVLAMYKPSTWQPTAKLWPIPYRELNLNRNLIQNPGY